MSSREHNDIRPTDTSELERHMKIKYHQKAYKMKAANNKTLREYDI